MATEDNTDRVSSRIGDPASGIAVVDGGDRACGELLLVLAARARVLPPHTHLRLVATDPAAPIDLPAWCHLTGHRYLGDGLGSDGRPHYDVQTVHQSHHTEPDHPWRRTSSPHREDTHP